VKVFSETLFVLWVIGAVIASTQLMSAQVANASAIDAPNVQESVHQEAFTSQVFSPANVDSVPYFKYGANVTEGYRFAHDAGGTSEGAVTVLNPYAGVSAYTERTELIAMYYPLFVISTEGNGDFSSYQRASFGLKRKLSRRWLMDISSRAGYGDEEARIMANLQTELGALRLTDKQLDSYSTIGLSWKRTRKQQLSLVLANSYSSLQPENENSNLSSARINVDQEISSATTLQGYSQVRHENESDCTIYGGGVGLRHTVSETTDATIRVGPEYGSRECGQHLGVAFQGYLQWVPSPKTRILLGASRDLYDSYLPGNRWADLVYAGFRKGFNPKMSLELSGGYSQITSNNNLLKPYSSYYASSRVRWHASKCTDVIAGFYRFAEATDQNNSNGPELSQNTILITVQWHPQAVKY
jgi:hypothetical protein